MSKQLNEEMLVNKNNTLQSENDSLKKENKALRTAERILKGRIELLAYFVKHTKADYEILLNDFILSQKEDNKIFYQEIFYELAKYGLFSDKI